MVKTYIDVRNEAVRQIEAAFTGKDSRPRLRVGAHPGRFDEAEIRRLAQQSPAILTSLRNRLPVHGSLRVLTMKTARRVLSRGCLSGRRVGINYLMPPSASCRPLFR
jgi:hypothetical protein